MGQVDETCNEKTKIDRVGVTSDNLTSRAGLTFLVHYLESIDIYSLLERYFGSVRQSAKGIPVKEAFKQLICFFVDGTNLHLAYFDELKKEVGYGKTIETKFDDLASSYQMDRFLKKFSYLRNFLFRRLLQAFFLWRLKVVKPEVILLDLDTMVMDNDDAKQREGVKPTYKKVKGFQPLQLKWGPYFVDAVFRGGSKHSNYGDTVVKTLEHVVEKIRDEYDEEVPIVLTADIGFFDQFTSGLSKSWGSVTWSGASFILTSKRKRKLQQKQTGPLYTKKTEEFTRSSPLKISGETGRNHAGRFTPAWSMKGT